MNVGINGREPSLPCLCVLVSKTSHLGLLYPVCHILLKEVGGQSGLADLAMTPSNLQSVPFEIGKKK